MDCNDVDIFDKTPAGIEDYAFISSGTNFFDSIEDIKGDGNHELIVDRVFAFAGTSHCIATWPVIYAWNGAGYADVSSEYKGYYRKQLADLERQLNPPTPTPVSEQASTSEELSEGNGPQARALAVPTETATPSEGETFGDADCLKAEVTKSQRFLGISPDAGMADAIKWADSNDPATRKFAVAVLAHIGTPEATEYLRTLSHDEDQNVAWWAKNGLVHVTKKAAVTPVIQGELITRGTSQPPAE